MGSIECVQGQGEGSREQPVLVPISEGTPQDVLQSFGVQENQEDIQPLHLALAWEQSIPLFSEEMREFVMAEIDKTVFKTHCHSFSLDFPRVHLVLPLFLPISIRSFCITQISYEQPIIHCATIRITEELVVAEEAHVKV